MTDTINIEDIATNTDFSTLKIKDENQVKHFVKELINNFYDETNIEKVFRNLRRKYHINPSKTDLRYVYQKFYNDTKISNHLELYLIKKPMRSLSGVLVVTLVLKPDVFSCPKKCSYCPTETDKLGNPTQPKSYLSTEPAMLRALQHKFSILWQTWDRLATYVNTGNISNNDKDACYKLEIILSGGTWESYPYEYRNEVMNDIYWAANIYETKYKNIKEAYNVNLREKKSLEEEIKINESAKFRVIGLTIETRPDFITKTSIKNYRRWGVTRVQIGVQHYDDDILKYINRECYTKDTKRAIKVLKNTGFKVVVHLMPDLPSSSPEKDIWMFQQALTDPDLQFDDIKIYPTAVCKSPDENTIVTSDIATWYERGIYTPYAEKNLNDLINVLIYYKSRIQPWVRIQRLIRDIPAKSIEAGYEKNSNLRQVIQNIMTKNRQKCHCIRCMEIGNNNPNNEIDYVVRQYNASDGVEYFITAETNKYNRKNTIIKLIRKLFNQQWEGDMNTYEKLYGFCRLRLDRNAGADIIKEIKDCAIIREVHVYGLSLGVGSNGKSAQHRGIGKKLVSIAEDIAIKNNYNKIAVIAGVGTRLYYQNKCGYELEGTYMIKKLTKSKNNNFIFWFSIIVFLFIFIHFIWLHKLF